MNKGIPMPKGPLYKLRQCKTCGCDLEKSIFNGKLSYCEKCIKTREKIWETKSKSAITGRFANAKRQAKRRNIEFTLSFLEYYKLVESNKCFYNSAHSLPVKGCGLDRKHPEIGYVLGNCVPCCWKCNDRKGKLEFCGFSYDRILELLQELNSSGK